MKSLNTSNLTKQPLGLPHQHLHENFIKTIKALHELDQALKHMTLYELKLQKHQLFLIWIDMEAPNTYEYHACKLHKSQE